MLLREVFDWKALIIEDGPNIKLLGACLIWIDEINDWVLEVPEKDGPLRMPPWSVCRGKDLTLRDKRLLLMGALAWHGLKFPDDSSKGPDWGTTKGEKLAPTTFEMAVNAILKFSDEEERAVKLVELMVDTLEACGYTVGAEHIRLFI